MNNKQKAAMFGLDARIALAIFGALSVITGAALFNAIKQAKVVAIVTELEEVSKAIEAYMLDTGQDVSHFSGSVFQVGNLINKPVGVTGWNGPYITVNGTLAGGESYVNHAKYDLLRINDLESNLGGANTSSPCTSAPCFYWIQAHQGVITADVAKAVDIYADGSDSVDSGRIRIVDIFNSVYFKGPPMLSQP